MKIDLDELDSETLTELGDHLTFENRTPAVLAEFKEGQEVSVEGYDSVGVITSVMTETFDFPIGKDEEGEAETEKVEPTSDEPAYVVGLVSGGMVVVDGGKLSSGKIETDDDVDPKKLARQGEEAGVYKYIEGSQDSIEEFEQAKKEYIFDHHQAALSGREVSQMEYEELINIPGVKDPHIGFSSLPDGWTRKSVLKAWASLGGSWTSCRADMVGEIRSPKRFCSALKDEVLMTTYWRGRF